VTAAQTTLTQAHPALGADLEPIREKVLAGRRLSFDDGLALFRTRDIFTLGQLANHARERLHGRRAYYNVNRHINYTNYCVLRCKFCSFYRPYSKRRDEGTEGRRDGGTEGRRDEGTQARGDAGTLDRGDAYELTVEQVVALAEQARDSGATEAHIVGGLHPRLPFSYYTDMCRAIKQRCPELHIKAFTAIEIIHFTRISRPRRTVQEVLCELRDAGLGSLPGGGAEIFDDRVHDEAYKAKVGEKHWFDVHRAAHDLGIPSNCTMLYGHLEGHAERVRHLIKLREHQDQSLARVQNAECRMQNAEGERTGPARSGKRASSSFCIRPSAFQCCIPLSFIPEGSELAHLPGPTGLDDLRTLAVARLMLDNIPHIKAFWPMQSAKLAQVALNWGVDDFDGTVVWYDITKREGRGTNNQRLTVEQIRRLIREAGCEPVERDTLYRPAPAPPRA